MNWDEKVQLLKPEEFCPADCPYRKTYHYPATYKLCGEKPLLPRGRRYLRREDCQLKDEEIFVEGGVLAQEEPSSQKRGRPPKNVKADPPPEEAPETDICSGCKQPLTYEDWNTTGRIGLCVNPRCQRFRQPQRWRKYSI